METMRTRSWAIEMETKTAQLVDVTEKERKGWSNCCIYKVPSGITKASVEHYKPVVVSFGPQHHGSAAVVGMEEHKERALLRFLRRSNRPIGDFLNAIMESLPLLMGAYESLDDRWRNNGGEFVKLMMVDACFMIEIFRVAQNEDGAPTPDYLASDPVFGRHGFESVAPVIRRDMLLIENQIPKLVFFKLLGMESSSTTTPNPEVVEEHINRMMLKFFFPNFEGQRTPPIGGVHVLDVVRKSLVGEYTGDRTMQNCHKTNRRKEILPNLESVWWMHKAGVILEKSSTNLTDINFISRSHNYTLRLPEIELNVFNNSSAESMFVNLMAFEWLYLGAGKEITSYVLFMFSIVHTVADVRCLEKRNIIKLLNVPPTPFALQEIVNLFNNLVMYAIVPIHLDLNLLHDVHLQRMRCFCGKRWYSFTADVLYSLRQNPFKFYAIFVSLFLGVFMALVLSASQTYLALLSYKYSVIQACGASDGYNC